MTARTVTATELAELAAHRGPVGADEEPILVAAAAWRTGSTLVQRLLTTDPGVLIWGEPLNEAAWLDHLIDQLAPLSADRWAAAGRPGHRWPRLTLDDLDPAAAVGDRPLHEPWRAAIAELSPTVEDLLNAHRSYVEALLAHPARAVGRGRWGAKEVRWGAEHLAYWRLLYPRARLVGVVRSPWAAWASYQGHRWAHRWPDDVVGGPLGFAGVWARQAEAIGDAVEAAGPLGVLVRHEDLVDPTTSAGVIDRIAEVTGTTVDPEALDVRTRSTTRPADPADVAAITVIAGAEAERFGYHEPNPGAQP